MKYNEIAPPFEKPAGDYLRTMTASPEVVIADVVHNTQAILQCYSDAKAVEAELLVLPELCMTGYSTADLFHNDHVLEQSKLGLIELAQATKNGPAMSVGAALEYQGLLFNCGVILAEGRIVGVVPKTHLPNYNEFYEERWFTSGSDIQNAEIEIEGEKIPFGTDLLFRINGTTVGMEICEDGWAPFSPGTFAALAGAEVIVNLSASNELIAKAEYRRDQVVAGTAGRLICAYVYSSAGRGESVADVVYGGHQIIAENGKIAIESKPHEYTPVVYDIDRADLRHDRRVNKTWAKQAKELLTSGKHYRTIDLGVPQPADGKLLKEIDPRPFDPLEITERNKRCSEALENVSRALAQRITDSKAQAIVLGLSGGLDSALALVIAMRACRLLDKGNDFIHTITMPGPASSERTQDNASRLATALGTTHQIIPITELTFKTLELLGHDQVTEDLTFENTQARLRTSAILMNYANKVNGFVQGTGNMSEGAQGYSTFNGDHSSMFNPSIGIAKTMVRDTLSMVAEEQLTGEPQRLIREFLVQTVSAELTGQGDLSQQTEEIIGPYPLHDFFQEHLQRRGQRPNKVGYLATVAFAGTYEPEVVAKWLNSFLKNYTNSQWKRNVAPDGPMVGPVANSPRGTLRMAPNTGPNWSK